MNNLFNLKLLKKRLENFSISEDKLNQSSEIINNWTSRLISGELDKYNEKMLQGDFLRDFFQIILGYSSMTNSQNNYNFIQHPKTEVDKRREPDGSLGFFGELRLTKSVIELKGSKADLDKKQSRTENLSPVEQAFLYIFKYDSCNWAIISNFKEIRLYSKERGQGFYHSFKILDLKAETQQVKMFIFLLGKENLISEKGNSLTFDLLKETADREQIISEKFYEDYKNVRKSFFEHFVKHNPELEKDICFLKTQKLLDRFVFICFCEDSNGLLPKGIINDVYKIGKTSRVRSNQKIWEQYKNLFMDIDLGRYDIDVKMNADMAIDPPNIGRYINEEYLSPSPGFQVNSKLEGGDFKISIKLDESTKNKIRDKILGGITESSAAKLGINLKDYVNNAISAIEGKLNSKFSPSEISSLFAAGTDVKKGTLDKIIGLASLSESDFKKALDSPYVPSVITDEIAEFAHKEYSDVVKSGKEWVQKNYTVNPLNKDNSIPKELLRIAGYTTNDSSLSNIKPTVSGHIGSDGKLHVGVNIETTLSSDDTKPSEQISQDKLGIQGKFTLTSKGDQKIDKAGVNLDANIDTSKMSAAQKVAIAESLGEDGDKVNNLISTGKVSLSTNLSGDYSKDKINVKASTFLAELKIPETGTLIKDASVQLSADYETNLDKVTVKIPDRATLGTAVLAKDFKKGDVTVKNLELTGRYVVNKESLKEAGLPDKIIDKVTANAKGMGNVYYSQKSFESMLDKYALAGESPESSKDLKEKILKASFKPPAFGAGNIVATPSNLSLDFNAVNGDAIRTGINFEGSKGTTQGKILVRDIAAKSVHIDADIENQELSGNGKGIRLSGIAVSSGGTTIAPNEIRVDSGDFNLKGKSSTFDINGQGINVLLPKTKEQIKDDNKLSVKNGSLHVDYKKDIIVDAKGTDINLEKLSLGKYTVSLDSKGKSEAKVTKKGDDVLLNVKASKEGFTGLIKDKEGKEFEISGSVGEINADLKTDLSKISFKASGENSVFRIKQKGLTPDDKGFDFELKVPQGVSVEFDKETKTFKMSGADGKEFKTDLIMKDYSGKSIGNLNLNLKDSTSVKMGDNYDTCEILTPKSGIDLSLSTKVEGSNASKHLDASIDGETKLAIDFKDKTNPKIEVGESGKDINLKLKYSQTAEKSEKTDLDLSVNIKGKTKFDLKSSEDKSTSLTLSPPSEGVILKGSISTGSGTITTEGLNIKSDKSASVNISENGIINGKDIKVNIKGNLSYTPLTAPGKELKTEKFIINTETDIEKLQINQKIVQAEVKFSGDVKSDQRQVSGAVLGRAVLKADLGKSEYSTNANYEAHGEMKGSYISTSGKLSAGYKDNTVTINGDNNISVKTGTNSAASFNSKIENFSIKEGNISGKIKLSSLDKSAKPDGKLNVEAEIKFTKTPEGGYKLEIEKGKILSDDCLKALLSQVADVIQQPIIADQMRKSGGNPKRLEEILKTDGYNFIQTSNLKMSGNTTINLDKDLNVKDASFKSSVDSVKVRVPTLTYTDEKGLALENKESNDTVLTNIVSVNGKVSKQERIENGVKKEDKKIDLSIRVDAAQLIEQAIKKAIGDIKSPVKIDFNVRTEGDKIALYINGKKSDVTFGARDIKISITNDNKIKVDLNMNNVLTAAFQGLKTYAGYEFAHKDKTIKMFKTAPSESVAFDKQIGANIIRALKGQDLSVTYSIPQLLEEYAKDEYKERYKVAKDLDITKGSKININDGIIELPLTKIVRDKN